MTHPLSALFWLTLKDPGEAALVVMGRPMPREIGWQVLGLGVVLNTVLTFATISLFPILAQLFAPLDQAPLLFAAILMVRMSAMVAALFWGGQAVGGRAGFEELLLGFGWLQMFQAGVHVGILLLAVFSSNLASFVVLGMSLYGIWISLQFVNVLHGFGSVAKSLMLLAATMVALAIGLSFFASLLVSLFLGTS
ncbi:hypothetical protein [Shimia marina]|uniref:Yip1 domain protein n=1 Tax=Shimia marina TaxID=321267 RepID=A0A0P1ET38_9RHOB|nr:hypothetical protein [Shimia marina]CUH53723.1 hypothetical protein SHM7688_03183 [Shimia marina]SFD70043.1 hypothetical protein SAMN04488037_10287 [Shimia marina]